MNYSIRPMHEGDLTQVNGIDSEAFPTQVPAPNYRQELNNRLARYVVACDDTRTLVVPVPERKTGLPGLITRIRQRITGNGATDSVTPHPPEKYIVGFAGIWVLADEAHITNIAVRKQYQRLGIGELLMISSINLSREMKASVMTLEVRASNLAAQNLYRKYGFTQVGVRRGYYLDNREDGIIMTTESITSASFQTNLHRLEEALAAKLGQTLDSLEKALSC